MSSQETQNTDAHAQPPATEDSNAEAPRASGLPASEPGSSETPQAESTQADAGDSAVGGAAAGESAGESAAEQPVSSETGASEAAVDGTVEAHSAATASAPASPAAPSAGGEAADAEVSAVSAEAAGEPAPEDADVAPSDSVSEGRPRKVALNPRADGELKAVGSVSPADGELTDQDVEYAAAALAAVATDTAAPSEVEIPKDVDLGDLESEIEAAMQSESAAPAADDVSGRDLPHQGARLQGIIQSIHGDDVFVDLGVRIPGVLQVRNFEGTEPPEVGKQIQVVVRKVDENEGLITVNLPRGKQKGGNWDAIEAGQVVDCMVNKTNKGGLEVSVGSIRGFLPAGQIDLRYVDDLEPFVGQKLTVKIIEANPRKRNLVVSRRQLLMEERREIAKDFWENIEEGAEFTGTVKTIKDYGAFVDLGGADGFLHIGQISWTHIKHPSEVLSEGQQIDVKVTKLEREKKRIGLTMKGLTQNPWDVAAERYAPETTVTGTVTRTTDFGAFVELEPGIEGLIHISELDWKRVRRVTDVVSEGAEVNAKVLEFDGNRRRISLSLKALREDPRKAEQEAADQAADEEAASRPQRRARNDLKGGIGSPTAGGGLFGNPNDFT